MPQRRAIEALLVKDMGLSLSEIRGERVVEHRERGQTSLTARVLAWLPGVRGRARTRVTRHRPGLTDREVWELLVVNDEDERVRQERAEKERRAAERGA